MKGIYLASFKAEHLGHDIVYQDINGERDIGVQDIPQNTRQGGFNVHEVIEYWINYIERGQEICQ